MIHTAHPAGTVVVDNTRLAESLPTIRIKLFDFSAYLEDEALPGPLGVERLLAEVRLPPLAPEAVIGRNTGATTPVCVGDLEVAHAVRIGEALQARGAKARGSQHLGKLKTKNGTASVSAARRCETETEDSVG